MASLRIVYSKIRQIVDIGDEGNSDSPGGSCFLVQIALLDDQMVLNEIRQFRRIAGIFGIRVGPDVRRADTGRGINLGPGAGQVVIGFRVFFQKVFKTEGVFIPPGFPGGSL